MTCEAIRHFLLWCTVIDYGILLVWFLAFVATHDAMYRIHGRWFRLSRGSIFMGSASPAGVGAASRNHTGA